MIDWQADYLWIHFKVCQLIASFPRRTETEKGCPGCVINHFDLFQLLTKLKTPLSYHSNCDYFCGLCFLKTFIRIVWSKTELGRHGPFCLNSRVNCHLTHLIYHYFCWLSFLNWRRCFAVLQWVVLEIHSNRFLWSACLRVAVVIQLLCLNEYWNFVTFSVSFLPLIDSTNFNLPLSVGLFPCSTRMKSLKVSF